MSSGKIPKRIHQTDSRDSRPMAVVAKGAPLSVRMILGSPYSRKRRSKTGRVDRWEGDRKAWRSRRYREKPSGMADATATTGGRDQPVLFDVAGCRVEVLAVVLKLEAASWLGEMGGRNMKKVALSTVKDDLSRLLRLAEKEEIIITRHGKPAGVLIGFESEDDWFDYRLENDPRFLKRTESARISIKAGKGIRLENL